MLVIMMLLLLSIDVDLHIAIFASREMKAMLLKCFSNYDIRDILVCLFACRNVKLIKGEDNSLQVLTVLHSIDEVSTHDVGLEKENFVSF